MSIRNRLQGVLGFGTAPLGNMYRNVPEAEAEATVDAAWERGVRYFDTAPLYGAGLSERRMGAALRERPRDAYVISTKVGRRLVDFGGTRDHNSVESGGGHVFAFSRDGVLGSLEASLERLGLDRVDIALVHDPDDH